GVTLNDPLPSGAGANIDWTFDGGGKTTTVNGTQFQITGSVGNEVLSQVSPTGFSLPNAGQTGPIHVNGTTTSADLAQLINTATVNATGDTNPTDNTATDSVTVVPVAVNDTYNTPLNALLTVTAPGVLSNDGTPSVGSPSSWSTVPARER